MTNSDLQITWKEIIIGIFFIGGLFAGSNIQDPYVQILQTLANASNGTSVHSMEVNNVNNYIFDSTLITFAVAIIVLVYFGIFGGLSIVTAYVSGFVLIHATIIGLILLGVSWICLWYGNERGKTSKYHSIR